jgi:GT2 family glycosyltransferase
MNDTPVLTVIIVNWNVRELLRDCLKSIYSQTQKIAFEVIVVDNASIDGSIEMVQKEFPRAKLLKNKDNAGFARANNQAIQQSRGRYVLLLNPDTVVLNDALSKMVVFMDTHKDTGAAGPRIMNSDNTVQLMCGRHFPTLVTELWDFTKLASLFPGNKIFGRHLMSYWPHNDTREVELISGACMIVRKETIERTGLMDEQFFLFAEETDWCYRIRKNGWKIYLNADAEVIHLWQQSVKRSPANMTLESYKSMYLFFLKHHGALYGRSYRTMVFIFIALRIPTYWLWQYLQPSNRPRIQVALRRYPKILRWSLVPNG